MSIRDLLIPLMMTILCSCGTETRLAKEFVKKSQHAKVAVYFPQTASINDAQQYDTDINTPLLDSISDDTFLDIMYNAYSEELKNYKLDIYLPNDPNDIAVDSLHWIALLTQVDIHENNIEYMDYGFGPHNYRYYYTLKSINVASWFDFNDSYWSNTQFHELNLTDNFNSKAQYRHGNFSYDYHITPLHANDIYDFAVYLGRLYASLSYDYFMNNFIFNEMKNKGRTPNGKLHYEHTDGKLHYYADDEGFIELPTEYDTITNQQTP